MNVRIVTSFSIVCLFSLFVFSVNQNVFAETNTTEKVPIVGSDDFLKNNFDKLV